MTIKSTGYGRLKDELKSKGVPPKYAALCLSEFENWEERTTERFYLKEGALLGRAETEKVKHPGLAEAIDNSAGKKVERMKRAYFRLEERVIRHIIQRVERYHELAEPDE